MVATYEYRCAKCASIFELRRDWNAQATAVCCPICQSAEVQRIFSPVIAFRRGADGAARMIGANPCGGCAATSCAGCNSKN